MASDAYSCASGGRIAAGRWIAPQYAAIVVAGDSLTDQWPGWNGGGYQWGLFKARSPVPVVYNAGVAGNTIGQLTSRWTTDVAAKNPDFVMTRIGTNNFGSGSTTDVSAQQADYAPIFTWHTTNSVHGVIHAVPPEQDTPGAAVDAFNTWLAAQCAASGGLLTFADDSQDMADASYDLLAGYTSDGTHMNGYGRRVQGVAMAPVLIAALGQANCLLLDPTDNTLTNPASNQHVKNPHMAGTGGTAGTGVTGSVPDTWDVVCSSGATCTAEIVAADGGDPISVPWLRVTPQTGASGDQFAVRSTLEHPAYTADLSSLTRLDLVAEVRFNTLDCSKFTLFRSCVWNGSNVPSGDHLLHMSFPETISEAGIVRQQLPRDNVFWADIAHDANTLQVQFDLTLESAGLSSASGSFDVRCVSVRGLQE